MSVDPHDQTRGETAPQFADSEHAPLSCNEAAALCTKAARGVGMSWGMAEEAGFAASWLVSHGIDGPTQLRSHLEQADGLEWEDLCPAVTPGAWQNAKGQAACPIILGATLCDYADLPEGPAPDCEISLGTVNSPILLVPFLSELGRKNDLSFMLCWDGGQLRIDGTETWLSAAEKSLSVAKLALTLAVDSTPCHQPCPNETPNAQTTAATVAALANFAMRTTVPATEESRAGAGSTLSDND
ncbi:DUF3726 domain-containing protein [Neptunicoccus cionae]|uniref:DUF3726 domain-containing protein n=1 Tax=Neptunicoccus cionae TaxID=2035344 RepID=A0A916QXS1_9RHOB|nr:DUF3726 domain-containing protein [Amylibacter cionae]GGA19930.1 hypothetical protein GCM10011498_21060 [Amylibacter cionae]